MRAPKHDSASDTDPIDPELAALEESLRTLTPRADRLNYARLLFLAGQASVARRERRWHRHLVYAWAIAATFSAVVMGVLLLQGRGTSLPQPTPGDQLGTTRTAESRQGERVERGLSSTAGLHNKQPVPDLATPPSASSWELRAATGTPGMSSAHQNTPLSIFGSRRAYIGWVSELLRDNLDPWWCPQLPRNRLQRPRQAPSSPDERFRELIEEFYGTTEPSSVPTS